MLISVVFCVFLASKGSNFSDLAVSFQQMGPDYYQGPVVQSIVSLTSSLRGQLLKVFMTLLPNPLIFFVEKMREAFALQKLLTFF